MWGHPLLPVDIYFNFEAWATGYTTSHFVTGTLRRVGTKNTVTLLLLLLLLLYSIIYNA